MHRTRIQYTPPSLCTGRAETLHRMTKRTYTSPLRAAAGAATRERILEAAKTCFERHGYAGTTMRLVAQEAGTSLESVNLAGPKPVLLVATLTRANVLADTDAAMLDLPEPRALFSHPDPRIALSALMRWIATANERISRLWRCLDQAADVEAPIGAEYAALLDRMRAECRRLVDELAARRALRTDKSREELADLTWLHVLPDQHHRLCIQAGWTPQRYSDWVVDSSCRTLLADNASQ